MTEALGAEEAVVEGRAVRGVPVDGVIIGTAGELGVGIDVTGTKVESGLFVVVGEVVEGIGIDGEVGAEVDAGVTVLGSTAAGSVAAAKAD